MLTNGRWRRRSLSAGPMWLPSAMQGFCRKMSVAWEIWPGLTPYPDAVAAMESHVDAMIAGDAGEKVICLLNIRRF